MKRRIRLVTTEADVQGAILEYLAIRGLVHGRRNVGGFYNAGGQYVKFGEAGLADIWAIGDGKGAAARGQHVEIEVKRPGGKLRPAQSEFKRAVELAGAIHIVAFDVRDVRLILG
jgi:hypothetical protein